MTLNHRRILTFLAITSCLLGTAPVVAQSSSLLENLSPAAGKPLSLRSTDPKLERNKKNVLEFYDLMFNQSKPAEAVRLYTGGDLHSTQPRGG